MSLPRVQLFEFNDLGWMPAAVRDTIVESLSRALAWGHVLRGLADPFAEFVARSGAREVLDLGAGAGGPARILARELARAGRTPPRFWLTDLHPRVEAWREARRASDGIIDFIADPVDATAIPDAISAGRARSVINVFHHFPPALGRAILADAVEHSRGIFIAEAFAREPLQFANFVVAGLPALLVNPLVSSRDRLAKAALTWLTPAALAMSVWDGVVSTLRVYSEDELRAMVAPLDGRFTWTFGTYAYPPRGRGTYFYGIPRR
jgi:hypothetical protein